MKLREIENVISDYHWMSREVDRLQQALWGSIGSKKSEGVAQYGLAAVMPKGSPGKSQPELNAMDRREKKIYKKLQRYDSMTRAVEHDQELLKEDLHKTIYDCMMEGMSYRATGKHLGISRGKFYREKETILNTLYQKDQKSQIIHFLTEEKLTG
ncbi:hypothetical protein CEY16_05485 [Halalkalibacillus sediminis]|uniref:Uncharacterized protein n=2 Tax=Halalkalibacillus sediminis TaxID=2018042 RepID=A0A2I0QYL8_9BACI|nr:hypothetical protein CEY16_05485 [Halalkalibacillus sediminis]